MLIDSEVGLTHLVRLGQHRKRVLAKGGNGFEVGLNRRLGFHMSLLYHLL
jgi:hypothetical protein